MQAITRSCQGMWQNRNEHQGMAEQYAYSTYNVSQISLLNQKEIFSNFGSLKVLTSEVQINQGKMKNKDSHCKKINFLKTN